MFFSDIGNLTTIYIKNFDDFVATCKHFGIEVNNNQLVQFKKHYEILTEWNKRINLVSRDEIKKITFAYNPVIEKHFLDSVLFLPEIEKFITNCPLTITVFDIGSGGGFPAIPLGIMKEDWNFVLCESIKKKADFLENLIKELKMENRIKILSNRVEEVHELPIYKNKYQIVTARGVAKLDLLIKYALPLLNEKGFLIAYKSKNIEDEIKNSRKIILKKNLEIKILTKEINNIERKLVLVFMEKVNGLSHSGPLS